MLVSLRRFVDLSLSSARPCSVLTAPVPTARMPCLQLTYYGAGADSGSYCKGNAGLQIFGTDTIAVCTALLPANCGAQACVMGTGSGLGGTPPSTSPVTYSELTSLWAVIHCPGSVLSCSHYESPGHAQLSTLLSGPWQASTCGWATSQQH